MAVSVLTSRPILRGGRVPPSDTVRDMVDRVYRADSRRVFATLSRLLGDFDLAEEAVQDAFAAAMVQWSREGVPQNPRAWLVSAGRFKAIDVLRRRARFAAALPTLAASQTASVPAPVGADEGCVEDDRLRLIFTCCHPALSLEARAALTLREVCGLSTEAIAHAFLSSPATIAQRIVRAKAKIRSARVPYGAPTRAELPERMDAVLAVIYLVFNEGYSAASGDSLTPPDLSREAIRLGRLLAALLPEPEAQGLLALMLLTESRRPARTCPVTGDLILLEHQDRSRWERGYIAEGKALVETALRSRRFGVYSLQAAIAAVHAEALRPGDTDWAQIVGLYTLLYRMNPSPVIELNRAAAVAMHGGPEAGLALVDAILGRGDLAGYGPAHATRAELCRRCNRWADARVSYGRALALTAQGAERRFYQRRMEELPGSAPLTGSR